MKEEEDDVVKRGSPVCKSSDQRQIKLGQAEWSKLPIVVPVAAENPIAVRLRHESPLAMQVPAELTTHIVRIPSSVSQPLKFPAPVSL